MMFPPMGFLGSAANMAAPSTCATTWLVITTATPNCTERNNPAQCCYFPPPEPSGEKEKKCTFGVHNHRHALKIQGSSQGAGRKPVAHTGEALPSARSPRRPGAAASAGTAPGASAAPPARPCPSSRCGTAPWRCPRSAARTCGHGNTNGVLTFLVLLLTSLEFPGLTPRTGSYTAHPPPPHILFPRPGFRSARCAPNHHPLLLKTTLHQAVRLILRLVLVLCTVMSLSQFKSVAATHHLIAQGNNSQLIHPAYYLGVPKPTPV